MKLNQNNFINLRIHQHSIIQNLIEHEQFVDAQDLIHQTLSKYGNFIGLISDYCAMAYMNNDFTTFNYQVSRLHSEFNSIQQVLSMESNLRTRLTLGKFLEEKLELTDALNTYNYELVPSIQISESEAILLQKLAAQKLRLQSQLSISHAQVSQSYLECLNYSAYNSDLMIELEHALILAEIELIGIDYAIPRFNQLIERNLKNWECRLIVFDVLEVLIRKQINCKFDKSIISYLNKFKDNFDLFESTIFKIYQDKPVLISELQTTQLSHFSRLRLIHLLNIKNDHKYNQLLNLIIDGLTSKDQKLVRKFVTLNNSKLIQIKLINKDKIMIGKTEILLKGRLPLMDLISSIQKNHHIDISDAIRIVFNQEFSESNFLRLRVMISRFNKYIQKQSGKTRLLIIKNQQIQLDQAAQFN